MVRATLRLTVRTGREREFQQAWEAIAAEVRRAPGNLRQALLRDAGDPPAFVITSDWESAAAFRAFERSPEQDALDRPAARVARVGLDGGQRACSPPRRRIHMPARVMVHARVDPAQRQAFESAFAAVSGRVRGTPGHLRDELLRSDDDPGAYVLLSEWESRAAFLAWEDAPVHREATTPMRPFWQGRVERLIYETAVKLA